MQKLDNTNAHPVIPFSSGCGTSSIPTSAFTAVLVALQFSVLYEETPPPKREAFKIPPPPFFDELDEMLKDLQSLTDNLI